MKSAQHQQPTPGRTSTGPQALVLLDRLEVGPTRIEARRLITPYRVTRGAHSDETELIYKYDEDVFDPGNATDCNLAGMIGAQVALNYGLFCRTMIFHGPFDPLDRRFLLNMAENTAREIWVKKFLEPNPFLLPQFQAMDATPCTHYLQADLQFPELQTFPYKTPWDFWINERDKHAVLSSGGKDSLLSMGLLQEMDQEVHPLFVNESGRHWYTALNAFRSMKGKDENTARVWTNSDRVFNWMLRQLPCIRSDFNKLRADIYPIRLWTVAVFLFGVLPIMRKRGIGRLIIGDEYDTTVRTSSGGIAHYDGLFDQSRFFDRTLSRYFMRKGWRIRQFSVLRPLSEYLIQKILTERYPHLQVHQTSCHAAHVDGERIRPCGRCEKCRRIVGMLKAFNADPTRCGYTQEQIDECLGELVQKGMHQELAGVRYLLHRLHCMGLVQLRAGSSTPPPDIVEYARFDQEHAMVTDIPISLRAPLYAIFKQHVKGFVQRKHRRWIAFDPFQPAFLDQPYPFELAEIGQDSGQHSPTPPSKHLWGEMTWVEMEQSLKEVDIALLPVGSIEQHGPHLPLDVDAFDAEFLAKRVAEACSHPRPLVLPLLPYGVAYHHKAFKGTLSISNDTLANLVLDLGTSLAENGISKLVIINGHGGNAPALHYAAQQINQKTGIFVCVDTGETSDVDIAALIETPNDVHAGEIETSTTLAVRPHLVNMDAARSMVPNFSSRYLNFSGNRGVSWFAYTDLLSSNGVMGDPTRASVEKGRTIWEVMIAHLVALIEDLKQKPIDKLFNPHQPNKPPEGVRL